MEFLQREELIMATHPIDPPVAPLRQRMLDDMAMRRLVVGAIAGAAVFPILGLGALWIAAIVAALLLAGAAALGPPRKQ